MRRTTRKLPSGLIVVGGARPAPVPQETIACAACHKTARTNGGEDEIENMQVVHTMINRMKHTLSNEDFINWCRRVVQHADAESVSRCA